MGAFNWIVFEAKCPNCGETATIRAQTHIASDYGSDGREGVRYFHNRDYRLGDKMAWWPEDHVGSWRDPRSGDSDDLPPHQAIEACYANCQTCKAELCAVILFENVRPVQVTRLTLEHDWPEGLTA